MTDLHFVGASGSAAQDVFDREVTAAQALFERRFDTKDRSLVLSNDSSTFARVPLESTASRRHALSAVARRMNGEEDILLLYVTSHGSNAGLAFTFPDAGSFTGGDELSPMGLRRMLDEAGIRRRVLVLSGCHSAVYVERCATTKRC